MWNKASSRPLCSLKEGEQAVVTTLCLHGAIRCRLQDMGLIPGAMVTCLQRCSGGDPVAYEICGAAVALRNRDAKMILVTPVCYK